MLLAVTSAQSAPTPAPELPVAASITEQGSATVPVGGSITDTATLAGGDAPTGTITFSVYAPGDTSCATAVATLDPVAVTGDGTYTSAPFTTTAVGTYHFVATYSGDDASTANAQTATGCAAGVTAQATPTLTTAASASVAVGGAVTDTASVTGGSSPSASGAQITFVLYGVGDPTCTGTPVFTSTVAAGTAAVSGPYTPTAAGTYHWIATYQGNTDNAAVAGRCADAGEAVSVSALTPTLTTVASPSVALGASVTDTAVLHGGFRPTGTITFKLYGAGDPTCAGTPVFTSTVPLASPTVSGPYSPAAAGTYRFIATYSGDPANNIVGGSCTDATESVAITTAASPNTPSSPGAPHVLPLPTTPTSTKCVPQKMADALDKSIAAALTGKPGSAFKATCGGSVRIVLRSKEIRPGNTGYPDHDGYTTITDTLTHGTKAGQISFAINPQGVALRKYAESVKKTLLVFAIVHVRPASNSPSSEAIRIFSLT
jgi:hypothetical protein